MLSEKKKKNDDDIATFSAVSKATSKKYLDDTGLGHLSSLIISFVRNYASPKTHNHDGVYAKSSHAHTTSQVTGLDAALAGKASASHKHDAGDITSGTLPVSRGGTGCTNLVDSANSMMDSLTVGAVTPTDNDYVISQVAGSGVVHKKPMSALWTWIKSKCDAIYQAKGSYAAANHTHSWSQITGKPTIPSALTYMPVGYVYISWSSTSPASLFGGSWVAITGRFPYFNAGTSTGGSNSHTLSVNELASHNHRYNNYDWMVYIGQAGSGRDNAPQQFVPNGSYCLMGGQGRLLAANISGVNAGNNAAHNNMPSYQTLYAWRRTA